MKRILSMLVLTLALALVLYGTSRAAEEGKVTSEDFKKQTEKALETAKELTAQQKEEYQKKVQAQIEDLTRHIAEINAKAKTLRKEASAQFEAATAELKKKQEAAQQKLKELQSSTGKAWDGVKTGLDSAMDELMKTYQSALSIFK